MNKIFIHVLDPSKEKLVIENFSEKIKKINYFDSGKKVNYSYNRSTLKIDLQKENIDNIDTILEITLIN